MDPVRVGFMTSPAPLIGIVLNERRQAGSSNIPLSMVGGEHSLFEHVIFLTAGPGRRDYDDLILYFLNEGALIARDPEARVGYYCDPFIVVIIIIICATQKVLTTIDCGPRPVIFARREM